MPLLLIVPYGIEIRLIYKLLRRKGLLIVPYGIEIKVAIQAGSMGKAF